MLSYLFTSQDLSLVLHTIKMKIQALQGPF
nr:MAG TPA: hypothetical protein [Caudoviricetes sp.]